jgi:hypothetical protein
MEMKVEDKRQWTCRDPKMVVTSTPLFVKTVLSAENVGLLSTTASVYDYYRLFKTT